MFTPVANDIIAAHESGRLSSQIMDDVAILPCNDSPLAVMNRFHSISPFAF
jgi:hypothetical protein